MSNTFDIPTDFKIDQMLFVVRSCHFRYLSPWELLFHLHAALTFLVGSSIFRFIQAEDTGPTVLFSTTALAVKAASLSQTERFLFVRWPLLDRVGAFRFRLRPEILREKKSSLNP